MSLEHDAYESQYAYECGPLPEEKEILVFVYGTLLSGYSNHGLLCGARKVGSFSTEKKFKMKGRYGFPMVVKAHRQFSGLQDLVAMRTHYRPIAGEVYAVDAGVLRKLDNLEGHPQWYKREQVKVRGLKENNGKAWMYIMPSTPQIEKKENSSLNENRDYDWSATVQPTKRRTV